MHIILNLRLEAKAPGNENFFGKIEEGLDQEGENGRGHGALEDKAQVIEANAGENGLAVAAGADEGAQGGGADIDDGGGLDAGQDFPGGQGQFNEPEPGPGGSPRARAESMISGGSERRPVQVFRTMGRRE